MESMKLGLDRAPNESASVYVLVRVFRLEQDNIGLKVFLDPEEARNNGELDFKVQTYVVKAL
jgi:hypothetical protein